MASKIITSVISGRRNDGGGKVDADGSSGDDVVSSPGGKGVVQFESAPSRVTTCNSSRISTERISNRFDSPESEL